MSVDVNVLIFYLSPKSFYPDVALCPATAGLDKPTTKTYFIGNERGDVTLPLYERISTHVGRKTFVVTGLSSGLSPYTITQWTGHSSLKAMKPYMALADKVKKESMKSLMRCRRNDFL